MRFFFKLRYQWSFYLTFILVSLFSIYPLVILSYKALTPNDEWSLRYFIQVFLHPAVGRALCNSLGVALAVGLISVVIAVPLAWLIARTDLIGKNLWRSAYAIPYALPPYVGAMAWVQLGNPQSGWLNLWFGSHWFNIYSWWGLVWIESSFLYTLIFLNVLTVLERMDPSLEEAAKVCGASGLKVFWWITAPLILPSVLAGYILVFLATLASFGVPAMIGGPARLQVLTTQIYTFQKAGSVRSLYLGITLALLLLIIALILMGLQHFLLKKKKYILQTGKMTRPSLLGLGRKQWVVQSLLLLIYSALFLLPLTSLLITTFHSSSGTTFINFDAFRTLFFDTEEFRRAVMNSFLVAALAASTSMVVGFFISYVRTQGQGAGRSILDFFVALPFAVPGTVLALALILSFSRHFYGLEISLYNTLFLIGFAYVVKYLTLALKTTNDGFNLIDSSLAEAARVSGANLFQTLRLIWFPLVLPSLIASWFLVFMPAVSELTMTLLLTGPGQETLGTLLFQLHEYSDATGGSASLLALFIVGTILAFNFTLRFLSHGRYGL